MASLQYKIETYSARVGRKRDGLSARIDITGVPRTHHIIHRAMLLYRSNINTLTGFVFNVGGLNFDGLLTAALMPFNDFDRHYHLLQTETPLNFYLMYDENGETTTKSLSSIALSTGPEPIGEGFEDIDALIAGMNGSDN